MWQLTAREQTVKTFEQLFRDATAGVASGVSRDISKVYQRSALKDGSWRAFQTPNYSSILIIRKNHLKFIQKCVSRSEESSNQRCSYF